MYKSSTDLECAQAVYNFLIIDESHLLNVVGSFDKLPHYKEMLSVLESYQMGDMVSFTHYLNNKYKIISASELWIPGNAKTFFSTEKSHNFYKQIIRNLKINLLIK